VLPLLGSVAAGKPIEALEAERTIEVPTSLLRGGDCFALKVRGDSMIGDGILDGDFVIVRKQAHATNGQTVVALIGSEATIKRYHRVGNRVELRSANPAYAPIVIDSETAGKELRIEGILTGLVRSVP
jgi:repressor LexA